MKGFLVDTSVLSQIAPGRVSDAAAQWFRDNDGSLYLPVVALSEIRQGVARLERMGASRKAETLSLWFEETMAAFSDFLVPISARIALEAGALSDRANAIGKNPGYADILIAATALVSEMPVATRNLRHFKPLGIACLDPLSNVS
ncbi:type II toxin-antitoxin system VapC family toxin [Mesorhizobium sp. WSM2561]|uniref:type II toxin-antitoxin system VapC family toxin n=1 Tax=Mesorhizobium sp. WSM2561 TaxID=1040985 RepID=UPI0004872B7D|nr:type II toxin-antitoxin system VapC family toxin [Mesorhizobium sp. WSM2561]